MPTSQITVKRKAQLRLRLLLILFASLPLIVAVVAVVWMVRDLITEMQKNQVIAVQSIVLQALCAGRQQSYGPLLHREKQPEFTEPRRKRVAAPYGFW
jgi:sensor histidine kinase regulating citrate/malate metabolism